MNGAVHAVDAPRRLSPRNWMRLMRFDKRLPAKLAKRLSQLARLGPRQLGYHAYARTLGTAAYRLADPARDIMARRHRRLARARQSSLPEQQLRERVGAEVGVEAASGVPRPAMANDSAAAGSTQLVDIDGRLGVRKSFAGDRGRFLQVLQGSLDLMKAGCPVAPVIHVDWADHAITSAWISGTTFAATDGARADAIEDALIAIHRAGYVLDEINESDFLFTGEDRQPVVVGLQHLVPLSGLSRDMSTHLRDADRHRVNELFGTQLPTARSLRLVRSGATPNAADHVYAPILLRDDISWGNIWNTDVGIARWNYILGEHLPIPSGGTILDLGANTGFNPLQMLRHGASSAVGVEIDEQAIRHGKFVKQAVEWLDNRRYDFRYIHGSIGELPKFDLPKFDLVTALCSIYYLSAEDMLETARYVRTLSDLFVLQCNTDRLIDRSDEETFRKASVESAIALLEGAGFSNWTVIAPRGYSRPLVIGRA